MRPVGPSPHVRRGAPAHSCDAACGEEHANPGGTIGPPPWPGTPRIYIVAGDGTFGFSGDGGPATGAALSYPDAVAVNGASLVFADQDTSRIRQVTG